MSVARVAARTRVNRRGAQIIGVVGALIFGPKNLAGLGKDLGKVAGSLKAEVRCEIARLIVRVVQVL